MMLLLLLRFKPWVFVWVFPEFFTEVDDEDGMKMRKWIIKLVIDGIP